MSEDIYRDLAAGPKKVQRRKKTIKPVLMISILIPFVLCIVLFVRFYEQTRKTDDMIVPIANPPSLSMEQESELQQEGELQQEVLENTTKDQEMMAVGQTESDVSETDGLSDAESIPNEETTSEETKKHKVYLTFDDGPGKYTEDILAILEQYQVKATFFVVGKEGKAAEEALKSIVDGGHTLGLHSYSHKYKELYQSVEAFSEDFIRLQDYVYEVTGVKSTVYRFPGGSSNTVSALSMQEFADYLESQGVEYYDWNISAGDGGSQQLDVQTVVENCTRNIQNHETSIILLHDSAGKQTTVEALPIIIENILAMEDTVILPITEDTEPVQHIDTKSNK